MVLIAKNPKELEDEAARLNELFRGKTVKNIYRYRPGELVVQFEGGTTLFVDHHPDGLEFSAN